MYPTACLITLLISLSKVYADGGFASSCPQYGVPPDGGTLLTATCYKADGSKTSSSIDLNTCIVNNGGNLACQKGGGFANSCDTTLEFTEVYPTVIDTYCTTGKGKEFVYATIDINDCIGNHDGVLAC